jgi:hypothetical protein
VSPTCATDPTGGTGRTEAPRPADPTGGTGRVRCRSPRHGGRQWAQRAVAAALAAVLVAAACSPIDEPESAPSVTGIRLEGTIELDFVPRAGCDNNQARHCYLPFPSDAYTVAAGTPTGRRVELSQTELPRNISGRAIDPLEWNRSDGFSAGSPLLLWAPQVDLLRSGVPTILDIEASMADDAPIVLLDAETLERRPYWAEFDSGASSDLTKLLVIRPAVNLQPGRRYIVALRDLLDRGGESVRPERAFRAYRDRLDTDEPRIEARRNHMENLFEILEEAGVLRSNLFLAWDFTVASTESTTERMLHLRDDAFGELGDAVPSFEVTGVFDLPGPGESTEAVPADDTEADDTEADDTGADDTGADLDTDGVRIARYVSGTVDVPLYLTGEGAPASRLRRGTDGLPERNPETPWYPARFVCALPRTATPDEPASPVLYGHGLFTSADSVAHEDVQRMASEHRFVYCATDWIGLGAEDLDNVAVALADISEFPTVLDRLQQAMLNSLYLGRLLAHPDGLAAHEAFADDDGNRLVDHDALYFEGDGHGAVLGGALTAVAQDWERAVLTGAGMNHSTLFERGAGFDMLRSVLEPAYGDDLDRMLVMALLQMLWDRVEVNGYAANLIVDPLPGTPPHEVLVHVAFGDFQVADLTAFVLARTAGIPYREPLLADNRAFVDLTFALDEVPTWPHDGSALVLWDSGGPSPPVGNRPPRGELDPDGPHDPHRDPRGSAAAREQKARFLREGVVIDVCDDEPCITERR